MSSSGENGPNETFYIIVGAAAGGGIAACVALTYLALRRRGAQHRQQSTFLAAAAAGNTPDNFQEKALTDHRHAGHNNNKSKNNHKTNLVSSEIVVDLDEPDVSTLGDPVHHNGTLMNMTTQQQMTSPDEQTASVENDYDYRKLMYQQQYGGMTDSLGSMERTSDGVGGAGGSIEIQFANERIEIRAPAGKLGMVIDTPGGGVPVVHAIKDDSPLNPEVKVGDRLVAVDGDDVTYMTALQVSKLIALKSDQDERIMVFVRGLDIEYGTDSLGNT